MTITIHNPKGEDLALRTGADAVIPSLGEHIEAVEKGIEKGEVHQLAEHLGLGKTEVLHVLGMEPSTFSRRRGRLTRIESEKVLLMAAVAAEGLEAFGNDEKAFHRWFRQPNILLGDKTPMDSCRFTFGIREVEKLLARIRTADFIA